MKDALKDFFFGNTVKRTDFLYDTPHLIALILTIVVSLVLIILFKNKTKSQKLVIIYIIFGILLLGEISSRVVNLWSGEKDILKVMLPAHFCSIIVWVMIFGVITKNKHVINLSAIGGLIATSTFMFYPAVGFNVEVMKFSQYYSVISHCVGFIYSTFLIGTGLVTYKIKDAWSTATFIIFVFGYSAILNFVVWPGSNYMYYVDNITNGLMSDTWFRILYFILLFVYIFSFYAIYYLVQNKKRTKIIVDDEMIVPI